jgi:hypothetical protein
MKRREKKLERNQESRIQQRLLFRRLKGKPFWIWDVTRHRHEYVRTDRQCCFNHIVGLPQKNGKQKPLFDYQKTIVDALEESKRVWVKKASGIGVTELILRYMAWLCVRDNSLRGSQMVIFTGPRLQLAVSLIRRLKGLFEGKLIFDTKETVIELNRVRIEAFPSYHTDTARGLPNVSFVFVDEGDFFPVGQQEEVRAVAERYIAKSGASIAMVSTPNQPRGLFENIEREPEGQCLYRRIFLDYKVGLGKIYTEEEIKNARASPSFPREYELQYLGRIGNVFAHSDIEEAIRKGWDYNPMAANINTIKCLGIDPAFGSSNFGFVLTQQKNEQIEVLYAYEEERPNLAEMVDKTMSLMDRYDNVTKIYVDAANPEVIRALKRELGEREDYEDHILELKRAHVANPGAWMKVMPVSFSSKHKELLAHAKMLMEKKLVAINEWHFADLITSLRTAKEEDGSLVKSETAFDDLFDAYRLSLWYWRLGNPKQRAFTASQGYRSVGHYRYPQSDSWSPGRFDRDYREYRY